MFQAEPADYSDPRALLEEKEQEQPAHSLDSVAMATALGRLLVWILEAQTPDKVWLRVHVVAHKVRPELIGGISFSAMAAKLGQGRSSAHKLSKEFASIFSVRGMNDKSDEARRKYREAWKRTNFRPCQPTNLPQPHRQSARVA